MKSTIFGLCFVMISCFAFAQEGGVEALNGKELFRNNCKACHNVDKKLVGPALKGLEERRDSAWIYNFIKGSQEMIAAGDEIATSLYQEYNEVLMPNQQVNNAEIAAILQYIREESVAKGPADGNPIQRPVQEPVVYSDHFRFSNYSFWIPFTLMVILLTAALYYMTIYSDIVDKDIEEHQA